ncbi:3'-5' exonuclease [Falsarthrobacter nasiphocae]|uniref:DNA polymerase-3 subunit epsilon n=1 Tax=Falsarthrobacter nasiphocae TaxID=189863 RepID=A0AAE3YCM5_9MICC|nr:3'-5' exonuclease [Falsarthrobacter nasiphocae]MDR6891453.1 DNA polymerase-3 subunit epsilon [Falsarthrobacter nasiphocae]
MSTAAPTWLDLPCVGFDLETTGRDPRTALVVTAALIIVNGRGEELQRREWLVDPGVEIPQQASDVHGITTAKARAEGIPAAQAIAEISQALDELVEAELPLVAFNGAYDFTVMAHERQRHGITGRAPRPVIDPFILQKHVDKYRKGKKTLTALCESYGISLENAHTAADDALAAVHLARALGTKFPAIRMGAAELHDAQVGWAKAQAADFQEYKRRTDPSATIEGGWPTYGGSPA